MYVMYLIKTDTVRRILDQVDELVEKLCIPQECRNGTLEKIPEHSESLFNAPKFQVRMVDWNGAYIMRFDTQANFIDAYRETGCSCSPTMEKIL